MAITTQINTPNTYRRTWKSLTLSYSDSTAVAGTFNGITCVAASAFVYTNTGWLFRSYVSSGAASARRCVTQYQLSLPTDYIPGTDLRISFYYGSSSALTNGTVEFRVGLTQPTSGTDVLGGETETQYQTYTESVSGVIAYQLNVSSKKLYTGTNLNSGDSLSLVVLRRAQDDSQTVDMSLYWINVEYQSNSFTPYSSTSNSRIMTPSVDADYIRSGKIDLFKYKTLSQVYNGVTCTAATRPQDIPRIQAYGFDFATPNCIFFSTLLPNDYKQGTPIDIETFFYPESGVGGTAHFGLGFLRIAVGATFPDPGTTATAPTIATYVTTNVAAGTTANANVSFTSTYDPGPSASAGDPIELQVYRDPGNAADTLNVDVEIVKLSLKYTSNNNGTLI